MCRYAFKLERKERLTYDTQRGSGSLGLAFLRPKASAAVLASFEAGETAKAGHGLFFDVFE